MSWLSAILGLDSLHNASKLSGQAQDYRNQAARGYQNLTGTYGNLANAGASDYNTYANMFLPYLNQLNYAAGIPGTVSGSMVNLPMTGGGSGAGGAAGQLNAPQYTPISAVTGAAGGGAGSSGAGAGVGGASPSRRTREPSGAGMTNRATPPVPGTSAADLTSSGAGPMGQTNYDAYALTPAQQVQLNQQVGNVSTAMNSAIDEYRRQFAGRGQPVPPEGEAMIREHFQTLGQQARAGFAEAARANRQQTIQNVLELLTGIGGRGESVYGGAAQGLGSVASGQGGLAGQTQSEAAQQQGSAFNNLFGLLSLGGYGLSGGFNKLRQPDLGGIVPGSYPGNSGSPLSNVPEARLPLTALQVGHMLQGVPY